MRTIYLIGTAFVAAVALVSAGAKLRRDPHVVKVIHATVGVPMRYLPALAACEVAGAVGLIAGIWWAAVGVVAAVGLVLYFIGAVVAHIRVGDFAGIGAATFALALVAVALVARLLTM